MLTLNNITRFFEQKVKHNICPSCNSGQWSVIGEENNVFVVKIPLDQKLESMAIGPHMPAIGLMCQNCYYLKFYSYNQIVASIEQMDENK
ncbi:MAG: hypothetical protein A3E87_01765 [Gammaproteobacteria bacterium RIFCSPHIGHO2_12_FULL_35_23]|nr:MAG: hypothetical protein A3E87_01765 [Gammaproteobacteria bacterium RIFCSPHIGHO2_12_FULL_35_23]